VGATIAHVETNAMDAGQVINGIPSMFRRRPTTRETNRREFAYSFRLNFAEGFRFATRPAEPDQWVESSRFLLSRATVIATPGEGMALWRDRAMSEL
jgi:hypothetical protein